MLPAASVPISEAMQNEHGRGEDAAIRVPDGQRDGLLREMLASVLAGEARLAVVGTAADTEAALELAVAGRPDVTLIGLDAESEQQALALAQRLARAKSRTRIVFLGERPDTRTLAALPAFVGGMVVRAPSVRGGRAHAMSRRRGSGLRAGCPGPGRRRKPGAPRLAAVFSDEAPAGSAIADGEGLQQRRRRALARSRREERGEPHQRDLRAINLSRDRAAHPRVKAVLLYLQEAASGSPEPAPPDEAQRRAA